MIEKWLKDSYCDGVRELHESRNEPVKFTFWSVTMLAMISGTGYFIYRVVEIYRLNPTATTYSIVPMTAMEFPQIVLCFNGGLNASAMIRANLSMDLMLAISEGLTLGTMDAKFVNKSRLELDNYLQANRMDIRQFYSNFGYECEDIADIVYPAATDRAFVNLACKNVSRILSPYYGVCFLYADNGYQHWPGTTGGMRMYLKSPPDSISALYPDIAAKSDRSQSFVVFIQKNFFILTEKQILVPANMKSEISLNTKRYIRLPESSKSCSKSNIASSDDCFNRCYADTFHRFCGCYPFRCYNPVVEKSKNICNTFEEQTCQKYDPQPNFDCQRNCTPLCDEWVYDVTVSYTSSGSKYQPVASLWIFYDSMYITKIEDVYTYTIEAAIAEVGYQANLWLGLSVCTIVQSVYYVFIALCQQHQNSNKRSYSTRTLQSEVI